jgi:hypothetical protein
MTEQAEHQPFWRPKLAALDWRRDSACVRSPDQPMFDLRLYLAPDRALIERRGDALHRTLPSLQLWTQGGAPVIVPRRGAPAVRRGGQWEALPLSELLAKGRPCSFQSFAELWPELVSIDEFLADRDEERSGIEALQERSLASAGELLQREVEEGRLSDEDAMRLLQDFAELVHVVPREIASERQALENAGHEPAPEWEGKVAGSRLATPLALLSVQLQLAASGVEVPLRLLRAAEILQLGLDEDMARLRLAGEGVTAVLKGRRKAEFDGKWRYSLEERAAHSAAEHLQRCGGDELAALHTLASYRDLYWVRVEEELGALERSCRREARKARILSTAAGVGKACLSAARGTRDVPGAILRTCANLLRAWPARSRLGEREA